MTAKRPPVMQCAVCRRPLVRAAALLKGLPVGPVCAVSAGLVSKPAAARAQGLLDFHPSTAAAVVRDELTIDLFEGV